MFSNANFYNGCSICTWRHARRDILTLAQVGFPGKRNPHFHSHIVPHTKKNTPASDSAGSRQLSNGWHHHLKNASLRSRAALTITSILQRKRLLFLTTIPTILFWLYLQQIDKELKSLLYKDLFIFESTLIRWKMYKRSSPCVTKSIGFGLFSYFFFGLFFMSV